MSKFLAVGIFAAALLVPSAANAAPAVALPPGPTTITFVSASGSGCPAGSTAVALSPNSDAITVMYDYYVASVGVGSTPTDNRKNCEVQLRIRAPQGYSYAVARIDHRGYGALAPGASAVQTTSVYFSGQSPTAIDSHNFTGPMDDPWLVSYLPAANELNYSKCGEDRNLNINTELLVNAGTSDPTTDGSILLADTSDASVYQFAWKKCG